MLVGYDLQVDKMFEAHINRKEGSMCHPQWNDVAKTTWEKYHLT